MRVVLLIGQEGAIIANLWVYFINAMLEPSLP